MRISSNKNRNNSSKARKIIWLLLILVALAGVGFGVYYYLTNQASDKAQQKNTEEEAKVDLESKRKVVENKAQTDESKTGQSGAYTPPTSPDNISLEAQRNDPGSVTILTKLYGYSDGTCKLTATNGARTTSQTASIIFNQEYSLCQGFNIPVDSIGKGTWTIKLDVTAGESVNSKEITYEVK